MSIRHEWYQTESHVVVTVLAKGASADGVKVEFEPRGLSVGVASADYRLRLELAHDIVPEQSACAVTPSKLELRMKKACGGRWDSLEALSEAGAALGPHYPSSNPHKRDWNKIESQLKREEADEKPQGEDGLKKLFETIYGQGNDEVRKAMNKSYMESGGTVLSTNWKEVGKDEVPIQPPDGMEWKKWE